MDSVNITADEVWSEAESHPFMALIAFFICLFVLGSIAICVRTASTGASVLAWAFYYLTAPIHMPFRWAYRRI